EINTEDKLEYQFFDLAGSTLKFQVKANNDAHLAFTQAPGVGAPMYEVFIGGWNNTKSVIRKNGTKPDVAEVETPGVLTGAGPKGFWIIVQTGSISVGYDGESNSFLHYTDPEPFPVHYYGVCTGWGATGEWHIEEPTPSTDPSAPNEPQALVGKAPSWVPTAGGEFPDNAFEGGQDVNGETLYIARARHEDALIPGKFVPSHSVCYVAFGGGEHAKDEYEVLCGGADATWVPTEAGALPPNAFPGGNTEDGETLYIGRASHEGSLTIGKVQPSHNTCYIPFDGVEVPKDEFEVLVIN
ncbi:hypothetical protein WDU94_000070, partial [Cyamophila willieti]